MRQFSEEMMKQFYGQESGDPFLMLVTLTHESFEPIRFVNNVVDISSRGENYLAFPVSIVLPADDGETSKEVKMTFDNVSLALIDELRTVTTAIEAKIEMVLASNPDKVELELVELKLRNVSYNRQTISAALYLDDFLNTEMASERYTPTNFPGIF